MAELYNHDRTEYSFEVRVPANQIATKGYDPEEPKDNQPIKEVLWMAFLMKYYHGGIRLVTLDRLIGRKTIENCR